MDSGFWKRNPAQTFPMKDEIGGFVAMGVSIPQADRKDKRRVRMDRVSVVCVIRLCKEESVHLGASLELQPGLPIGLELNVVPGGGILGYRTGSTTCPTVSQAAAVAE